MSAIDFDLGPFDENEGTIERDGFTFRLIVEEEDGIRLEDFGPWHENYYGEVAWMGNEADAPNPWLGDRSELLSVGDLRWWWRLPQDAPKDDSPDLPALRDELLEVLRFGFFNVVVEGWKADNVHGMVERSMSSMSVSEVADAAWYLVSEVATVLADLG